MSARISVLAPCVILLALLGGGAYWIGARRSPAVPTIAFIPQTAGAMLWEVEHLGARTAAESHVAAISEIEAIVEREGIDCEFKRTSGYLFLAKSQSKTTLQDEFDAARNAGLSVEWSTPPPRLQSIRECLRFPDQAQFHPVKYLAGLDTAIQRLGASLYSQTEVTEIASGRATEVKTSRGFKVSADSLIVATNTPRQQRLAIGGKGQSRDLVWRLRKDAEGFPVTGLPEANRLVQAPRRHHCTIGMEGHGLYLVLVSA